MKYLHSFSFILLFLFSSNIKNSDPIPVEELTVRDKKMRLIVFVDRNTKEHLAYKIWIGTKNDWSSFGRKMMNEEADKRHNKALVKDFLSNDDCMLVYSLVESGKKKYKRATGSKSYLQKRKKELSTFEKTVSFHETKCL